MVSYATNEYNSTKNQLFAYIAGSSTSNASVTASESYITALNNFQNNGQYQQENQKEYEDESGQE